MSSSGLPSLQDLPSDDGKTDLTSEDIARSAPLPATTSKGPLHSLCPLPPALLSAPSVLKQPSGEGAPSAEALRASANSVLEFPSFPPVPLSSGTFSPLPFGNSVLPPESNSREAAATSTQQWIISDDQVPTLPEQHPLEMTATFIPHVDDASTIALRVSSALERCGASVAVLDTSKAKVSCTSSDGVNFRVRLYRGKAKFHHGIIVEVQRREGFSLNFHLDTALAILDEAEGRPVSSGHRRLELPEDAPRYAVACLV